MDPAEETIRLLLAQRGETRRCEYKGAIEFPPQGAERWKLVRDLIAFSNTEDGGDMLVGVDDKTRQPLSLSTAQVASWDQTKVVDALRACASPVPPLTCRERVVDGDHLVLLSVAEFVQVPTVCIRAEKGAKASAAMILRQGALYTRTEGAQSVEISSEVEMRALIDRAVIRRGDAVLRQIRDLIESHPGVLGRPSSSLDYSRQIAADFDAMGDLG